MNKVFNTQQKFNSISVANYLTERKSELGEFIGTVITGIYEGIKNGANDVPSDFKKVTEGPHMLALAMMEA